jgi:hypothetical protein
MLLATVPIAIGLAQTAMRVRAERKPKALQRGSGFVRI